MRFSKHILKSKIFQAIVAKIFKFYSWLIFRTCKMEQRISIKSMLLLAEEKCTIFSYWHGRFLIFPEIMQQYGSFTAVVSSSRDGDILTAILNSYGHRTIRGSSRKHSTNAMRGILKLIDQQTSFAITPDGPKGPCFEINGNITLLAHKYNLPVIAMSYSATRFIKLKTWDQFIIPLPFSKIIVDISDPLYFKEAADNQLLKKHMLSQMQELDQLAKLEA